MSDRPSKLFYTGDGSESFPGIGAKDLDAADIARLSDAQLTNITADNPATGKPLYQKTEPASRQKQKRTATHRPCRTEPNTLEEDGNEVAANREKEVVIEANDDSPAE